jgi:tight adherence protein C
MMIASLLAAIAAFATVVVFAMPYEHALQLAARLKKITGHRKREARFVKQSVPPKASLRVEMHSVVKFFARVFKVCSSLRSEALSARLRFAGIRNPTAVAIFLFARMGLPLAFFAIVFVAASLYRDNTPVQALYFALIAAAIGFGLPRLVLMHLITRRQRIILRAFPDALDLLLICVQSGMSMEAALAKVTKDIAGQSLELAEELSLTMAELTVRPSRWEAYQNLGERTGLSVVKLVGVALSQAERHGTSISQALSAVASECREIRFHEAERKAATLPPKLTVPLVTFFLPVLLVVILAPAGIRLVSTLDGRQGKIFKSLSVRQQPPTNFSNMKDPR